MKAFSLLLLSKLLDKPKKIRPRRGAFMDLCIYGCCCFMVLCIAINMGAGMREGLNEKICEK
jgi:hypothetical protein